MNHLEGCLAPAVDGSYRAHNPPGHPAPAYSTTFTPVGILNGTTIKKQERTSQQWNGEISQNDCILRGGTNGS
jgi:hypothetical protein